MNTPAAPDKYTNEAQQRILALVLTLAGHELDGLAPGDIAKLQGCSPSVVTRDLANLKAAGWAEQIQVSGRWRLGPQPTRIGLRHLALIDRAERKVAELKSRFGSAEAGAVSITPQA